MRYGTSRNKVVSAEDAVHLIQDGATVTVGGFVAQGAPEHVLAALGQRYRETGSPKNLTLLFGGGPGDSNIKGLNHFAQPGMLKRAIGGHYGQAPLLGQMAMAGAFEAYLCPMGCVSRMIRCAASNSPGHLTTVGFGTLVDPKQGGGKLNKITKDDIVTEVEIEGKKYLFYKALPIDVAIIRGTTADTEGNITMERESLFCDHMIQAMAARSRRGLCIAQVERLAASGTLHPRSVKVPATMVDCVVQAPAVDHTMSYFTGFNPAWTGEVRAPTKSTGEKPMKLDERKIIARRATLEIVPDQVINLGIGMPEGVALIAEEENVLGYLELTTEPGVHGGIGVSGHDFGPASNSTALIEMASQFDFYNGGGLDICFLGNAETDAMGNVNVTRVGKKLTGPGGFIDISQSTKRVNLMGTFTAGGLQIEAKDGQLRIIKEGSVKKFVKSVKEITFSGVAANQHQQIVHYITERCVFVLGPDGLELTEIAPGIDLEKDILAHMEFKPIIREPLRKMAAEIFTEQTMGLREKAFGLNIGQRLNYVADSNTLYIDLKNANLYKASDVRAVDTAVRAAHAKVGRKMKCMVTYDNFDCAPFLIDHYNQVCADLEKDCYESVRRYNSRSFSRHKLAQYLSVESSSALTVPMEAEDALAEVKKTGVMLSSSTFFTFFQKHADLADGEKISPEAFQRLLQDASKN